MCGIAGILGPGGADGDLLSRMAGAIAHRGPDDEGVWTDAEAGIGFANRRLAIIDRSPSGHQPMKSSDGRIVLTYNGEIYNHAELRREIESKGGAPAGGWRGHSDTETLIELIAKVGLDAALNKCVGMFALAMWDRKERTLSLARDRFGEKPLYYGWAGRDLVFASELKAIRQHPRFDATIEREAVALFAARSYIPAPLSIYRGVFKLPPGCILTVTGNPNPRPTAPTVGSNERGIELRRYWSYREVVQAGIADPIRHQEEALDELDAALGRAVQDQSIADVPVGAFLSGGIDSSTIVALYQRHSPATVKTFTIGFADQAFNEAGHAAAVARHFGTDHHEWIVSPEDARSIIPKLPDIYDEPFADSSQIPTFLVSSFARQQVTVSLTGDGGDELFGGYDRYALASRLWSRLKRAPASLRAAVAASLGRLPESFWHLAAGLTPMRGSTDRGHKVRKALRTLAGARDLGQLVDPLLDDWSGGPSPVAGGDAVLAAHRCALDLPGASDEQQMMLWDALHYLPDDILCKLDRATMAVSLEGHAPFLDHRVAEVAARIAPSLMFEGSRGKAILRKLLARHAPEALFERPKAGFGVPVGDWIRGPLREWAEDLLDPRALAQEGWFDAGAVDRRWQAHRSGRRDSTQALWSILMFQAWLRRERG